MGVSGSRSSAAPRAGQEHDAGGQREHSENRRQRNRLQRVRGGLDGPEVEHRLAARVRDALVREGHQSPRDEHYPDDDERNFHGVSPFDCSPLYPAASRAPIGPWSSRSPFPPTTPRIASSKSLSLNGLQRYAAAPDFSARSRNETLSREVMKLMGMTNRSRANPPV